MTIQTPIIKSALKKITNGKTAKAKNDFSEKRLRNAPARRNKTDTAAQHISVKTDTKKVAAF